MRGALGGDEVWESWGTTGEACILSVDRRGAIKVGRFGIGAGCGQGWFGRGRRFGFMPHVVWTVCILARSKISLLCYLPRYTIWTWRGRRKWFCRSYV